MGCLQRVISTKSSETLVSMSPSLCPYATVLRHLSSSPYPRMVLQAYKVVVTAIEDEDKENAPNRPNHLLSGHPMPT